MKAHDPRLQTPLRVALKGGGREAGHIQEGARTYAPLAPAVPREERCLWTEHRATLSPAPVGHRGEAPTVTVAQSLGAPPTRGSEHTECRSSKEQSAQGSALAPSPGEGAPTTQPEMLSLLSVCAASAPVPDRTPSPGIAATPGRQTPTSVQDHAPVPARQFPLVHRDSADAPAVSGHRRALTQPWLLP